MADYETIIQEGCLWRLLEERDSYHLTGDGEHLLRDLIEIVKDNNKTFGDYSSRFRNLLGDEKSYIESFVDSFKEFPQKNILDKINNSIIGIINMTNISYESIIGFLGLYLKGMNLEYLTK